MGDDPEDEKPEGYDDIAETMADPDSVEDPELYHFADIGAVGLEIWQVKSGTIFDNILVTDSIEEADAHADAHYFAHVEAEKEALDAMKEAERAEAEAARKAAEEAAEAEEAEDEDDEEEEEHDEL